MFHRLSRYAIASAAIIAASLMMGQQPQPAQPQAATQQTAASAAAEDGGAPAYIKPETPEQRRERVGLVDPGPNPDEKTVFYRYGKAYHIVRFDKKWAAFDQEPGLVRPFAFTPFVWEIYQVNDKYVWVWAEDTPPTAEDVQKSTPPPAGSIGGYTEPQVKWLRYIQPEFSELKVPDSPKTILFEESSEGLPTSGNWRNSLAVADMNGDGFPDIIVPPQRGGSNGLPTIFLGDGKGHWTAWNTTWPYRIDYGAVVAADFNKDGKMDLAFSIHLQGVRVFLGDGKGHFTESVKGLSTTDFPTRRLVATDVDGDGYPDIVAISEGPAGPSATTTNYGKIRAFLNVNKASEWKAIDVADPKYVLGGDYLAVGNFNGDKTPDFVGSSVFFQAHHLIYLSDKKAKLQWVMPPTIEEGKIVPFLSYYTAMTAGHFSSKALDDALVSFVRFWPDSLDPQIAPKPRVENVVGIDRITFTGEVPQRVPLIRFEGKRPISGLAAGDFDGDGKLDILFTRFEPQREGVILLGDGKGNFARAKTKGLNLRPHTNYDVTVADVNGDGRPDVIIMYESGNETRTGLQDGSIQVFLNRGVEGAAAAKSEKKK
jgi:hypothetical protein